MSKPLSNLLSHIKNAQRNRILVIEHPKTKLIIGFLKVLREHGYIRGYRFHSHKPRKIEILLKYRNQAPAVNEIIRISKPSKKLYITVKALADLEAWSFGALRAKTPKPKAQHAFGTVPKNPPIKSLSSSFPRTIFPTLGVQQPTPYDGGAKGPKKDMSPFMRGIYILSTPKGMISSTRAYKLNTGGEIVCHVW
jgi:small subunit ribosomal protein S8